MIKKKFFNFIFAIFTVISLSVFLPLSAFAATDVVDNDALKSAPGNNFGNTKSVFAYKTGSGYNNDYRIASTSNSNFLNYGDYGWGFNAKSKDANHYAYLNNKSFNNPRTAYQIGENGGYVYLNQNTAPGGWNHLKKYKGTHLFIAINGFITTKSGSVGADATKIEY